MKKLIFAVLLIALSVTPAFAVGTAVVSSADYGNGYTMYQITATADASDGSYPSATLTLPKAYLYMIEVDPDNTATPQDNYDIAITNARGAAIASAQTQNMDTTSTASVYIPLTTAIFIDNALTVAITGNNVNSAVTVIKLYFVR